MAYSKDDTVIAQEEPAYPYGLCITLDNESIEKLGITDMPKVGSTMMIKSIADITATSEHKQDGGKVERSITLQITDMAISGQEEKSTEQKFYPAEDKSNRHLVEDF